MSLRSPSTSSAGTARGSSRRATSPSLTVAATSSTTTQGRAYIDATSGYGVTPLGHAHPRVVDAIRRQSERMIACPAIFANDTRAEYTSSLVDVLPGSLDRVFLCNSGTEAVEGALKLARLATGRPGIVALNRGFHGRTFGALSATHAQAYRAPFEPLLQPVRHVPADDIDALDAAVDKDVGAVVLELVQGEGGVHPLSHDYVREASRIARDRGAMLIVDEVQTGFGRTGTLFACDGWDLTPDLLCLGKGIAGGVAMGAVAFGETIGRPPVGSHGSTFGGNPLACAAASATLDVLVRERLAQRAATVGRSLLDRLSRLPLDVVREVRGAGLMIGVELRTRATPFLKALQARGVLALPAGSTVIRLLPPLNVEEQHVDRIVEAIQAALTPAESRDQATEVR